MRGVGPVPVMSPMSKSFRKRERSASRNVKNSASSSPAKKQKLTVTHSPETPAHVENVAEAALPAATDNDTGSHSPSPSGSASQTSQIIGHAVSSPATPDGGGRLLRPRQSMDGVVSAKRTRRPFYSVYLTEDDATKILSHRIKIWWPLDKRWYNGEVRNYDSEQRQHWIVYDDHEEEWLKLDQETFKLQLLPGDTFERTPRNTASKYTLLRPSAVKENGNATVCSDQDENPSSRTASEDSTLFLQAPSEKKMSVYVRRRHSRGGSRGSASMPVASAASNAEVTASDNIEVQSPIRIFEPSKTDLSSEGQRSSDRCVEAVSIRDPDTASAVPDEAGCEVEQEASHSTVANDFVGIERWPLSRNVAELLRYIEIRSGGRRGTVVGGRLLNQVWRGMIPVWDLGNLFGLKLGSSTQLLASGESIPDIVKSAKIRMGPNRASLCMLISWNGFTLEKNARLKEVLESSLRCFYNEQKQVCWRNSLHASSALKIPRRDFALHTDSGSYLSVTLLCVPPNGRHLLLDPVSDMVQAETSDRQVDTESLPYSAPATELVFTALVDGSHCGSMLPGEGQETCFNTKRLHAQTRHTPYAAHTSRKAILVDDRTPPCIPLARIFLDSSLQELFDIKWKDLSGNGLRLSFNQTIALLSSRCLSILLRIHRLNTEAVLLLERSSLQIKSGAGCTESRPGLQELLSISRKGRRTAKNLKRLSLDDGLPLPKRIRIIVPEVLEQGTQSPIKVEEPNSEDAVKGSQFRGNILKLRRCPTKRGMWCVAATAEPAFDDVVDSPVDFSNETGKRRFSEYVEEEELIGDYETDVFDDFDGDVEEDMKDQWPTSQGNVSDRKKRRRGAFGGYELKSRCSEACRSSEQEFPPCMANLLIVQSDRGWREAGVSVELQRDGDSSALIVSLNGEVLYSHKPQRYIQAGIPNKHTHALMWRGGRDWILEFPDKLQWSNFRSMHDACCNQNARAQSVKHIPIPGVREVPDLTDHYPVPFFRARGDYIHQTAGEMESALLTSRVLYDMDSEDEDWLFSTNRQMNDEANIVTEDVFEKVMDQLERASYLQKQEVPLVSALEQCHSTASPDIIRLIHAHWLNRRQAKGMALIRCFQPAPCERYEALVQAYEAAQKSSKQHGLQQPATFAFCLRPNGLDVPNKQKQRSHRRPVPRQWNTASPMSYDESYGDQQYLEDSYGLRHRDNDFSSNFTGFDPDLYSIAGSPGSDPIDEAVHAQRVVSRQRSKGRKAGRKPRRMKSISGGEEFGSRRALRPFVAPATAMNLDASVDVDLFEGDSCSSMDFDLNDDAVAKAQLARKAARIAASKAAKAQELYALADAAMKKAVACVIEAEALAAAERAAKDSSLVKNQVEHEGEGSEDNEPVSHEDDDDLLLPISNWTQEYGSGLIQKGETPSVASPRKSLRYMSLSNQSSLFKGMVS